MEQFMRWGAELWNKVKYNCNGLFPSMPRDVQDEIGRLAMNTTYGTTNNMSNTVQQIDSDLPQYRAVRADMLSRIESGEWSKGEAIPPLNALEEMYPASRMTILKALHLLQDEGYFSVEHGRGTFVRRDIFSGRVGILCGDDIFSVPPPPFAAAVCQGLKDWLGEAGFEPRIYVVEEYTEESGEYLNHGLGLDVKREMIEGLALVSTDHVPNLLEDAEKRGLPLVDIGANISHPGHVSLDHARMISDCLQWLVGQGRRRVAFCSSIDFEIEQFRRICRRLDIESREGWILDDALARGGHPGDGGVEVEAERRGFEFARRLMDAEPRPDALLMTDDIMAKGASQALLATDILSPHEVLLMSASNSAVPVFYPIPLARYEFDTSDVVERAGAALLKQIHDETIENIPPVRGHIIEPDARQM